MDAVTKSEDGAPSVCGCGPTLSNLCRKFRVKLKRVIVFKAQETTLDGFFV